MEPQDPQKPCLSSAPIFSIAVWDRVTYLMGDYVRKNCCAATYSFLSSSFPSDSLFHSVYLASPHKWSNQSCIFLISVFQNDILSLQANSVLLSCRLFKRKKKKSNRKERLFLLDLLDFKTWHEIQCYILWYKYQC